MMSLTRELMILMVFVAVVVRSQVFNTNYEPSWGSNHLTVTDQGREVQLLIDSTSGAGFRSKQEYCSGVFTMQMKISDKLTAGVITSFYLLSRGGAVGNHDEIDFEFLGTDGTLQTNVFTNDSGHREQRIKLGFDPSKAFHTYEINLNDKQILFKVDGNIIRVFDNTKKYVWTPLHVEATIWNVSWAGVVDWSKAPFTAFYRGFNIQATPCR